MRKSGVVEEQEEGYGGGMNGRGVWMENFKQGNEVFSWKIIFFNLEVVENHCTSNNEISRKIHENKKNEWILIKSINCINSIFIKIPT